jgi:hypothetical protein
VEEDGEVAEDNPESEPTLNGLDGLKENGPSFRPGVALRGAKSENPGGEKVSRGTARDNGGLLMSLSSTSRSPTAGSGVRCAQRDEEGCSNGMALGRGATESKASSSEPESEDEDARTGVIADITGVNEHVKARGTRTASKDNDPETTGGEHLKRAIIKGSMRYRDVKRGKNQNRPIRRNNDDPFHKA